MMSFVLGFLIGVNLVVWGNIIHQHVRRQRLVTRRLRALGRNGSW
jgi:hypothetical protein